MSIFQLSSPTHGSLPFFREEEVFSSDCTDTVLNNLFSVIARKFKVREVYLSLPGVPSQELIAMGLPPHPLKESLIGSLSYMQSYSRVIVVEDTTSDPFLSTHPLTSSEVPRLGFIAAASVLMKDVKVGNLCVMDTKAHSNFGTLNQGLLVEFADTIAGIWTDRQQLYQELRRDGVHMQQSVLGVLRPPLVRLIREADAVGHSLTLLEAMWRATTFNQLDKTASSMQKDVNYFEYLVSTAIRVVSLAQIHDGMQMKHPMVNIGAIRGKYVYEFDQEGWRSSMRELIYHYGLLSVWVYSDDKEEFMRCFLAAHPDVLHFCIAAVLGHLYCSNCQQNIHITTSFSTFLPPTATLAKEASVSTKSSDTSSTFGRSAELSSQPTGNLANRRKLCIQISSQDRLPPLPKEMRESLDILSRQYLRGQVRQVTNHCFQLLVPVEIDTSDAEQFDETVAEETAVADAPVGDDGSTALPDGEQSIHSHGALSRHQELQLQQEQQRKQLLQRQKRALFPDLASSLTNPLKSTDNASTTASLIAETTLRSRQFRDYDDFGDVIDVASGAVDSASAKEASAQAKLFPSGFTGILALPSYKNIAQTIVDSCRSLLQMKSPSHGRSGHSKVSPSPSVPAQGAVSASKGTAAATVTTKTPPAPSLPSPTTTSSTVAYNNLPPGHSGSAGTDADSAVGPSKTTPRGREAMRGHVLRASYVHNKVSPTAPDVSSAKGGQFQGVVVG